MTTQNHTTIHCLLCITPVKRQGDVCPQCEPRYIALGRVLIEYASKLEPLLLTSPQRHISAPVRFVPDLHFFLKELDTPIPYEDKLITHRLTRMELDNHNELQQQHWYGHNIPSTLMAATINPDGFPEEPEYFVPVSSWEPLLRSGTQPDNNHVHEGKEDGQ